MALTQRSTDYFLSKDHHTLSFSSDHKPALTINPGESVRVETWDCYMGQVKSESDTTDKIDHKLINGATGPIYVNGAQPGDTLSVSLLEINPTGNGAAMLTPGQGQLHEFITGARTRIMEVKEGLVYLTKEISFPMRPMVGVIGVAPQEGEIGTIPAGQHGGNLDNNLNRAGSTLHLPIWHPGGLLGLGDMHASMGDGEICGTGVEIGGEIVIRVDLLKQQFSRWPVTETADSWITHGTAEDDITLAMKYACEEAAHILVQQWGFTYDDAFFFLSTTGDLGVAQAVHPCPGTVVARMVVPKIPAAPQPYRKK